MESKKSREGAWANFESAPFPDRGTLASEEFYRAHAEVNSFLMFVVELLVHQQHMETVRTVPHLFEKDEKIREIAKRVHSADALVEDQEFIEYITSLPSVTITRWQSYSRLLGEMLVNRYVDNYLMYLSSLLFEIFTQKPETLRSSEQVTVEFVLSQASIEDLVRALAERKVLSLSYSSFDDLTSYFDKHFGVTLFRGRKYQFVKLLIETRNINTHNRGRISRIFLERIGDLLEEVVGERPKIGQRLPVSIELVEGAAVVLLEGVTRTDKAARTKLQLQERTFSIVAEAESSNVDTDTVEAP